uniref:Glycerol-3-phosphate dehydrogenase [NAD(P)+] n=1 Tax=uncultured bacterium CSLF42 TaxID=1091574 RepID=G4WVY3_9BACT|nr:NAD(P)H-dependent glycerol-3-phosphate dehydrogenase [uncultured bacterium CSLF42]
MTSSERIAVLGAGSWGATLAGLLADKGQEVALWEIDPKAAQQLDTTRRLATLPDLALPPSVKVSATMADVLRNCGIIVSATPTHFVRATMKTARGTGALNPHALIVSVSKGLEEKTLKQMSEVIEEELGIARSQIAVLGGPSHAEEVCRRIPTLTVIAGSDVSHIQRLQKVFQREFFRVYIHSDMMGVEISGALKNIFAIASGISDGLGYGDNTRAALLTRGLNEMTRIGVKMGAQRLTFFGLAGMGDLMVTCLSRHSRNWQLGHKIGLGKTPGEALAEMTMVAEGFKTAPSAHQLAQRLGLDCPLTREIYDVLYGNKDPRTSLHDLMRRETYTEWQGLPEEMV